MSVKSFIVILVLSVVVTYGASIIEVLFNNTLRVGGLPLRFGSFAMVGESTTNYIYLLLDIIFWFMVIFFTKKLIKRLIKG
jgi:hypothetical protein